VEFTPTAASPPDVRQGYAAGAGLAQSFCAKGRTRGLSRHIYARMENVPWNSAFKPERRSTFGRTTKSLTSPKSRGHQSRNPNARVRHPANNV